MTHEDYKEKARELSERFRYEGKEKEAFIDGYRHGSLDAQIEDLRQQIESLKDAIKAVKKDDPFPDVETR